MSDNVVTFTGISNLELDPSRVIADASNAELTEVVIIGFCADGSEYFASSKPDGGDVLWHLERARHKLMLIADEARR